MSQTVDIAYPKDKPAVVRIRTSHAPFYTLTPEQARTLAAELVKIANEVSLTNNPPPAKERKLAVANGSLLTALEKANMNVASGGEFGEYDDEIQS